MRLARVLMFWQVGRGAKPLTRVDAGLRASASLAIALAIISVGWRHMAIQAAVGYSAGDSVVPTIRAAQGAEPMLVVWLSTRCVACVDSAAFYRRVTASRRTSKVTVVSPEPVEQVKQFLSTHGITPDSVLSTDGDWMKFKGTPTLLLVSPNGKVSHVWFGRLTTAADEERVLSLL
jgi:hypothetical protein